MKQSHDIKLAENLSSFTKKIEGVNKSTQKSGEVFENEIQQEVIHVEFDSDKSEDDITPKISALLIIIRSSILLR